MKEKLKEDPEDGAVPALATVPPQGEPADNVCKRQKSELLLHLTRSKLPTRVSLVVQPNWKHTIKEILRNVVQPGQGDTLQSHHNPTFVNLGPMLISSIFNLQIKIKAKSCFCLT